MIWLTRLNGSPVVINAELIQTVEATPDTVIGFSSGLKLAVLEPIRDVVNRVYQYQKGVRAPAGPSAKSTQEDLEEGLAVGSSSEDR
jgi:flagellar protein FlbD